MALKQKMSNYHVAYDPSKYFNESDPYPKQLETLFHFLRILDPAPVVLFHIEI